MEAWQATERARAAMAGAPFPEVGRVTVSGGVCDLARAETRSTSTAGRRRPLLGQAPGPRRGLPLQRRGDGRDGREERAAELRRGQTFQSIRVLARSVDAKDPSTRRHSERVAGLAASIAEAWAGAGSARRCCTRPGSSTTSARSPCPDAVLFKPDRLVEAEMVKVRMHAALGAEMLSDVLTAEQAAWVRGHHERWDGEGYPDRLAGQAIPEGARILHLADAWDVMTSNRPYVEQLAPDRALAECRRLAGSAVLGAGGRGARDALARRATWTPPCWSATPPSSGSSVLIQKFSGTSRLCRPPAGRGLSARRRPRQPRYSRYRG